MSQPASEQRWRIQLAIAILVVVLCPGGNALRAATINLPMFLDATGVIDPRGPGRNDDVALFTGSSAHGIGMFELDTVTNVLSYELLFTDRLLAGMEIGAELRGTRCPEELVFSLPRGHYKAGLTRQLVPAEVSSLTAGEWTVIIRTEAYPDGEIGGYLATAPEPPSARLALGAVVALGVLGTCRWYSVCALFISAALCASVAPALAQPFYPLTYEARRASGPITLDGQLDEPAWARADPIDQFSVYQQGTPPAQPILTRLLWDDTYLYAGLELQDNDLWAIDGHDAYLWESDVAELFFQPTPGAGPYYELEVSPKGDVLDLYWLERLTDFEGAKNYESGLEAVVDAQGTIASAEPTDPLHDDVDEGWTLELRIPRAALAPFSAGDAWGFLASAADYPRSPGESTLQFTSLLPAPFGFHTFERYERLTFVSEPWLVGDADGDSAVGLSDFGLLKAHFGQPGTRGDGEFTRDRQVDLADFGVLEAHFGNRVAAVPEPNSARLALAGMCASLWVGRRRPGGLRQFWAPLL